MCGSGCRRSLIGADMVDDGSGSASCSWRASCRMMCALLSIPAWFYTSPLAKYGPPRRALLYVAAVVIASTYPANSSYCGGGRCF